MPMHAAVNCAHLAPLLCDHYTIMCNSCNFSLIALQVEPTIAPLMVGRPTGKR